MGTMGAGKTLAQTMIALAMAEATNVPIYANYEIKHPNYRPVGSMKELWDANNAIFAFDEMWITLDSRGWKNNIDITQWVNQVRKKGLLVLYTTQHISQVDIRVRNGTDILVLCERKGDTHILRFADWHYNKIGRTMKIPQSLASAFYPYYDTFETIKPIKWWKV